MYNHLKNERGVILAFTAVALVAFIALTVVGVDLARLAFTATEVQTVADIAATAGARTLAKGGSPGEVDADAQTTVSTANLMDGSTATIAADDVNLGYYDVATATYSDAIPAGLAANAVKADGRKTVTNMVAAALGTPTTDVHKIAVAAILGPGRGCGPPEGSNCAPNAWDCFCQNGSPPCLPIAAPDCMFTANNQLPSLQVSSSTGDTAAWTAFQDEASDSNIRPFMYQSPCGPNGNAMQEAPGNQDVGPSINLNNGISSAGQNNVFDLMQCISDQNPGIGCAEPVNGVINAQGGDIFTIPIFHLANCTDNMNQAQPIVGFATVRITGVIINGSDKSVQLQTISYTPVGTTELGGGCFQTGCTVRLAG